MTTRRLWIVGAGGFGAEVLYSLRDLHSNAGGASVEIAFAVNSPEADSFMGLAVRSMEAIGSGDEFVMAIGAGQARERIHHQLVDKGARPLSLVAPTALVGHEVAIGDGCVLSDFTMLTGRIAVGRQFQCNIYSYVAHDCVIGDFVTFAPRVCCNGNIHIGDHAYIGTGAVLKQGTPDKPLRIGAGATVGMGAVVTKDVPEGAVVIGNPARPLER